MLSFLVDDFRISSVHNTFDEVRGVIDFSQLLDSCRILFLLVLISEYLPALAYEVVASRHLLSNLLLEGQEAFEVEESDVFYGTLHGQIYYCRYFGKDW